MRKRINFKGKINDFIKNGLIFGNKVNVHFVTPSPPQIFENCLLEMGILSDLYLYSSCEYR